MLYLLLSSFVYTLGWGIPIFFYFQLKIGTSSDKIKDTHNI